jgi:hypothetical protein
MRAKLQRDWEAMFSHRSKEPTVIGYGAIGGSDFVFMMTCRILLKPEPPRSKLKGAPVWDSVMPAEVATMKLGPFGDLFSERRQLSEADGEYMARWQQGMAQETKKSALSERGLQLMECLRVATSWAETDYVEDQLAGDNTLTPAETATLTKAITKRRGQPDMASQKPADAPIS